MKANWYNLHFLKLHDFGFFDRVSSFWILRVAFLGIALLSYPLPERQQQFVGKHDQVCRLGIVPEFAEGAEELLEQLVKMTVRYIHTQNLGRDEMHLLLECLHRIFRMKIYG